MLYCLFKKKLPQSVKRALKRRNFLCGATDAAKSTTRQLTSLTISVHTLVQPRHTKQFLLPKVVIGKNPFLTIF
jgi:hypothetical protein